MVVFENHKNYPLIEIEWLSSLRPIHVDQGNELKTNTLYYSEIDNLVFINSDDKETCFEFKELIVNSIGGVFENMDQKSLDDMSNFMVDYLGIYKSTDITIVIKKTLLPVFEIEITKN